MCYPSGVCWEANLEVSEMDDSKVWDLAVYSEDYVAKPELMEKDPAAVTDWTRARLKTKREAWECLKLHYPGKWVPVFYADGTRGGFSVPRAAAA